MALVATIGIAHPASAVTTIYFDSGLTSNYVSGKVTLIYHVHIPTNQWDGQGYINNGAAVHVRCYANPAPPYNYTSYYAVHAVDTEWPLYATADGIHVSASFVTDRGGVFNTNNGSFGSLSKRGMDRHTCYAMWVDGDGNIMLSNSNNHSGYF